MIKKSKGAPAEKNIDPNELSIVESQIAEKVAEKKNI